jgi:hypothetical protein
MPRGKKVAEKVQVAEEQKEEVEVVEEEVEEEKPAKKAKAPKAKSSKAEKSAPSDEEEEADGSGRRSFRLILDSVNPPVHFKPKKRKDGKEGKEYDGGRFKGKGPMQAAKKTFTQIARASEMEHPEHTFTIVETTAGSNKGTFSYIGTQIDLDEPQKIEKSTVNFNVKYRRIVKSYKPDSEEKPSKKATPVAKKGGRVSAAKKAQAEVEEEEKEVEEEEKEVEEKEEEGAEEEEEVKEEEAKPAKKTPAKKASAKPKKAPAKKGGKKK